MESQPVSYVRQRMNAQVFTDEFRPQSWPPLGGFQAIRAAA